VALVGGFIAAIHPLTVDAPLPPPVLLRPAASNGSDFGNSPAVMLLTVAQLSSCCDAVAAADLLGLFDCLLPSAEGTTCRTVDQRSEVDSGPDNETDGCRHAALFSQCMIGCNRWTAVHVSYCDLVVQL
jgi:hypothetical protein